jgi:hypothetical protein
MKRIARSLAVLLIPTIGLSSCSADRVTPPPPPPTSPNFKSLKQKDNLLHNLELAYNQRNHEEFRKLLDQSGDFIFFFSPTDVSEGRVKNLRWDVSQELAATQKMFNRSPPPGEPRADRIDLTLFYTEGDGAWDPFAPPSHPGETWYKKPVEYRLFVKVGDVDYTQNKAVIAEFTVRFTEVAGDSLWQIVTWRDDIGAVSSTALQGWDRAVPQDQTTWGYIKVLFAQ